MMLPDILADINDSCAPTFRFECLNDKFTEVIFCHVLSFLRSNSLIYGFPI